MTINNIPVLFIVGLVVLVTMPAYIYWRIEKVMEKAAAHQYLEVDEINDAAGTIEFVAQDKRVARLYEKYGRLKLISPPDAIDQMWRLSVYRSCGVRDVAALMDRHYERYLEGQQK